EEQLEVLASSGAPLVGITDGSEGSWFRTEGAEVFHQPAFPVENLVDTTGCGDVFHGAFLSTVLSGRSWRDCAEFASAAAAISASALGGRGKLPSESEVQDLIGKVS
ncbi:MAG: PfkB family carbohydrate kinase, partial [Verrucomicrobiota bacterium]